MVSARAQAFGSPLKANQSMATRAASCDGRGGSWDRRHDGAARQRAFGSNTFRPPPSLCWERAPFQRPTRRSPMKLYQFPFSPSCQKVVAIAHEVGVPLELATVELFKGEARTPAMLAKNPNGKVPILEDDDLSCGNLRPRSRTSRPRRGGRISRRRRPGSGRRSTAGPRGRAPTSALRSGRSPSSAS
jgi:hypothetical protein